jgi:hypothetical protein
MKWEAKDWEGLAVLCFLFAPFLIVAGIVGSIEAEAVEPDTKRYSVTVYSGGKAVEYWIVEHKPEVSVSNSVIWADGRTIVGGPVVIEPYAPRKPY